LWPTGSDPVELPKSCDAATAQIGRVNHGPSAELQRRGTGNLPRRVVPVLRFGKERRDRQPSPSASAASPPQYPLPQPEVCSTATTLGRPPAAIGWTGQTANRTANPGLSGFPPTGLRWWGDPIGDSAFRPRFLRPGVGVVSALNRSRCKVFPAFEGERSGGSARLFCCQTLIPLHQGSSKLSALPNQENRGSKHGRVRYKTGR